MVNAHFIYKQAEERNISITDFRYSVVEDLLLFDDNSEDLQNPTSTVSLRAHVLQKLDCKARENRQYSKVATKKRRMVFLAKTK